jgi:hypothetical protein
MEELSEKRQQRLGAIELEKGADAAEGYGNGGPGAWRGAV